MDRKWEKTENRFIAFFDVMGFKNLVDFEKHEVVIKLMEELSEYLKSSIDSRKFGDNESNLIRTTIFSDSILIISNNSSIDCAANLMIHSAFLFQKALQLNIPLKACISYGKFTADFDKSLFIGQPLIDAYLLQEELFLYSIILHHSFESFLANQEYNGLKLSINPRWIKFPTPFKNGKAKHYHLDWFFYVQKEGKFKEQYHELLLNFYNSVSGKTRAYVDNTLEMFDKMVEKKFK